MEQELKPYPAGTHLPFHFQVNVLMLEGNCGFCRQGPKAAVFNIKLFSAFDGWLNVKITQSGRCPEALVCFQG